MSEPMTTPPTESSPVVSLSPENRQPGNRLSGDGAALGTPITPASEEATALPPSATGAPSLTESQSVPEPEPVRASPSDITDASVPPEPHVDDMPPPEDEDDEDDDPIDESLPQSLEDAHQEIMKLRKSQQRLKKNARAVRAERRSLKGDTGRLSGDLTRATAKLEKITGELTTATTRAETAETSAAASGEELARYRVQVVGMFAEGAPRELAEALPLDELPKLFSQLNGGAQLFAPKEGPTSPSHVVVARSQGAPKPPATFDEFFANGRT